MWKCEKCGREFERENQDHYCGAPPQTIDEYIAEQAEEIRPRLYQLREMLREALPKAQEKIAWRMPTFWDGRNIIHFAAFKKHIGVYPGEKAMAHFAEMLGDYKTSKGAVQFPHEKPLPLELIKQIAKWCEADENQM